MSIQTNCPSCDASYTLADTQRGKKVRCRKCSNTFVVEEANGAEAPEPVPTKSGKDLRKDALQTSPRAPAKGAAPSAKMTPAAMRRDRDRDKEDEEDRPIRKPSDPRKSKSALPLILLIGGGVLVLLILGGVAVVVFVVYAASSTAQNGFNTIANAAQNAQTQGGDPNFAPPIDNPPKDAGEAMGWVDHGIQDKQIQAANWLATAPVDDALRPQVAASLERLLATPAAHDAALRALSTWAGPDNIPTLVREVPRGGGPGAASGPAMDALVRLKAPDAVRLLCQELPNLFEHEHAGDQLARLGNMAEKDVLTYLNHPEPNARKEAERLLQGYGTSDAKRFDQSLTDLSAAEPERVKQACLAIGRAHVDEARRAEVAKSLETPLDSRDNGVREAAAVALKSWGTKDSVPALITAMDRQEFGGFGSPFEACVEALAKLKDERGAEAVARHLKDFGGHRDAVVAALRDMGPVAEKAVAAYANSKDFGVADEAAKLLKGYGTKTDVVFTATLSDLNSNNSDTKKAACEFLAKQPLDPVNQKEVARALDKLVADTSDPFGGVRKAAAQAELVWGDKDSIPALLSAALRDNSDVWQPCVDAMVRIKDERAVIFLIGQAKTNFFHKEQAKQALNQLGPYVETALDNVMADPSAALLLRIGACQELINPANGIITAASIPALQAASMDPNPDLKKIAAIALKDLKKRTGTP